MPFHTAAQKLSKPLAKREMNKSEKRIIYSAIARRLFWGRAFYIRFEKEPPTVQALCRLQQQATDDDDDDKEDNDIQTKHGDSDPSTAL